MPLKCGNGTAERGKTENLRKNLILCQNRFKTFLKVEIYNIYVFGLLIFLFESKDYSILYVNHKSISESRLQLSIIEKKLYQK